MFQTNILEKKNQNIFCLVTFFFPRNSCRLWNNVEKYGRRWHYNTAHAPWMLYS